MIRHNFDPPADRLSEQAIRGATFTMSAQIVRAALQLGAIAILSRLLAPEDFGLFAMVAVFTNLIAIVQSGGLSVATVQAPRISHEQVSNLFWLNLGLGACFALVTIAAAPLVGWIYGDPRLVPLAVAMALPFLIGGYSVQATAILQRRLMFRSLAVIGIVSATFGIVFAICAALLGAGYWSLAAQQIGTALGHAILVQIVSHWRPAFFRRGAGITGMVGFGAQITVANVIGFAAANSVPFVIGLIGGPTALGLYNRANAVNTIPSSQLVSPLTAVAQPTFARLALDSYAFENAILSLVGKVALITTFVSGVIFVTADWITSILLGPGWSEAVPFLRLLCIFVFVEPLASLLATAMIASGAGGLILKSKIVTLVLIFVALGAGAPFGAIGVVAMVSVSGLLVRMPIFILFAARALPVSQVDVWRAILLPLSAAIVSIGAGFLVRSGLGHVGVVYGLFATMSAMCAAFMLIALTFAQGRQHVAQMANVLAGLAKTRRA